MDIGFSYPAQEPMRKRATTTQKMTPKMVPRDESFFSSSGFQIVPTGRYLRGLDIVVSFRNLDEKAGRNGEAAHNESCADRGTSDEKDQQSADGPPDKGDEIDIAAAVIHSGVTMYPSDGFAIDKWGSKEAGDKGNKISQPAY